TRPVTSSRPRTSCAPCAEPTRSTTTTASRPGTCRRTERSRMSRFRSLCLGATALALATVPALADRLDIGREALPEEIAAWDIDVRPDGTGLPEGRGSAA